MSMVNVRWASRPYPDGPSLHFIEGAYLLRGRTLAKHLIQYAQDHDLQGTIDFKLLNPAGGQIYVALYGSSEKLYTLIHWLDGRFPWLDAGTSFPTMVRASTAIPDVAHKQIN